MEYEVFTLKNGIRVIHQQHPYAEVSHCGLIIKAGSRDEEEQEQGLAHMIEHMLFKGTKKRKPFHILSRLDAVGGELNAYTTKEETCIYACFQNKFYARAIEVMADIILNSIFPEKELKKEKEVIVDEIYSYLDSPSDQIYDDFEEQLFAGHPIGRNILGTEKSVRSFKREDLMRFIKRQYIPKNMVLSSVGNISVKKLKKLLEETIGQAEEKENPPPRLPFKSYDPRSIEVKKQVFQVHGMIGNIACDARDERRRAMILLNNILGGPAMNSRLNLNVREKYGYTYHLDSSYHSYTDTGIFTIYYGTEKKFAAKTQQLILRELKKLREKKLGTQQLHMAKQQLKGQIALGQENKSSLMLALGKSLMVYGKVDQLKEVYDKIDAINSDELQELANEVFDENTLSWLKYIPD